MAKPDPAVAAAMRGAKQARQAKGKAQAQTPPGFDAIRKMILDADTGRVDLDKAKALLNPTWFTQIMEIVVGHLVTHGTPDLVILDMGVQWAREKLGQAFNEASCRAALTKQIGSAKTNGWGANWKHALMHSVTKDGEPGKILGNAENAARTLRLAPVWAKSLWFNEFSRQVVYRSPAPWHDVRMQIDPRNPPVFGQNDDVRIASWMQAQGIPVSIEVAGRAAATVAEDHSFNPVRDYLEGLAWDGTPRINTWLSTYFGANAGNVITRQFGRLWLISAVARIFEPGCQADYMLVLEGEQGLGKSTALSKLVPEASWFTDHLPDLTNKDSMLQVQGRWIVEMSELEAFHGAGLARIKAYLSRRTDDFRPPYGRGNIRCPRSCVFAGTVNKSTYLTDETGNRRFWTVTCGPVVDVHALERDRDQIWAEAVHEHKGHRIWWISDPALSRQAADTQTERIEVIDSWFQILHTRLPTIPDQNGILTTTVNECLITFLGMRPDQITKRQEMEVAKCLKALGWSAQRKATERWWEKHVP